MDLSTVSLVSGPLLADLSGSDFSTAWDTFPLESIRSSVISAAVSFLDYLLKEMK